MTSRPESIEPLEPLQRSGFCLLVYEPGFLLFNDIFGYIQHFLLQRVSSLCPNSILM